MAIIIFLISFFIMTVYLCGWPEAVMATIVLIAFFVIIAFNQAIDLIDDDADEKTID